MYRTCRHTMPTGRACQSPAMRDSAFCYFHSRRPQYPYRRTPTKKEFKFSALDNDKSISNSISDVLNSLLASRIDARKAGRLLYGLQIAATTLDRASKRAGPAPSESAFPPDSPH